jgi:hypothetical protein
MSHDLEASYAAAEIASHFLANPGGCFANPPNAAHLSSYAAREGKNLWPHADGVIEMSVSGGGAETHYSIALEFKRPNEGLHGILTAIGQSHAYLRKGYSGAVIVMPESYPGLLSSSSYVKDVLDLTSKNEAIGVFGYKAPNLSAPSPFANCLTLSRNFKVDAHPPIPAPVQLGHTETQWAHVREGSTDPDAMFRYLQAVKLVSSAAFVQPDPQFPQSVLQAVEVARPGADPNRYLSSAPGNSLADRAWRLFWFSNVLHRGAITGWNRDGNGLFVVNAAPSLIQRSDGGGAKLFFAGRADSQKNKLVEQLNAGAIGEAAASVSLVENYHSRAHSYREDIDSGCEHLGFVDNDGRLADAGFRFVSACERTGDANRGLPRALFLSAILREGALGAFLHYVYRLSEEAFRQAPMRFTDQQGDAARFDQAAYLQWLEDQMVTRLRVMRKVSLRGGAQRKPFQAELALLRSLGIVERGFRTGVGMVINWPEFQEALEFGRTSHYLV